VDLEDGGDGGVEVVGLGLRSVEDVDGVATTGNCEKRGEGYDTCVRKGNKDPLRKTGASSKYSENLVALSVALEMSRRKSGRKRAMSCKARKVSSIREEEKRKRPNSP
jgi:hypothetical protein